MGGGETTKCWRVGMDNIKGFRPEQSFDSLLEEPHDSQFPKNGPFSAERPTGEAGPI